MHAAVDKFFAVCFHIRFMDTDRTLKIPSELAGQTLAAALKHLVGGLSWSEAKRLIASRHIQVNGTLCLDESRRLRPDEIVTVFKHPQSPVPRQRDVHIVHADADLIVVEKPAGLQTIRRPEERGWSEERKQRQPTLEELLQQMLPRLPLPGRDVGSRSKGPRHRHQARPTRGSSAEKPRIRPVHRLDRDTSGLMIFALSSRAERELVRMFSAHKVDRTYLAVVLGRLRARTIDSWLVRDRGDGLRGSLPRGSKDETAKHAVTHVRPLEHLGTNYTLIECRLETGRTHQIRIHLSESGHMLCGEKIYTRPAPGAAPTPDPSSAPRHALHSAELQFTHPISGTPMHFTSPLPRDLATWLERLRIGASGDM